MASLYRPILVAFLIVCSLYRIARGIQAEICNGSLSDAEYDALQDLFLSTNGSAWKWPRFANQWVFPSSTLDPCSTPWYGVRCNVTESQNECTVTALLLNDLNLIGTLPSSLYELRSLQNMVFLRNFLSGSIPESLSSLTNLSNIALGYNDLTGTIPWQFFGTNGINGTTTIKSFDVSQNYMTGTLPASVNWSSSFVGIFLDWNYFSGPLPPQIGTASAAAVIYINDNLLSQALPVEIGGLKELFTMFWYDNSFTGSLPTTFGQLYQLRSAYLYYCYFTGPIPSEIGFAYHIQQLKFFNNFFSGSLPTSLGNLTHLSSLELNNNDYTGSIPSELGLLPTLQNMLLYMNSLSGPLPAVYSPKSVGVNLELNFLTGSLPSQLYLLTAMIYFQAGHNLLTGTFPTTIGLMKNLSVFDVWETLITGTLPTEIGLMSALICLEANGNYNTGTIPSEFGSIEQLGMLMIDTNYLTSTIPFSLTKLSVIGSMVFSANMLTGSVSDLFSDMGLFPHLTSIQLSENSLTGTLPSALFNSESINLVTLYSNCFEGSLPSTICLASNLSVLIMDALSTATGCSQRIPYPWNAAINGVFPDHPMKGTIPSCLFSLPKLSTLHLSGNGFTGTLPDVPLNQNFTSLVLANNALIGNIPSSIQSHPNWATLDLGYNRLSGTLFSDMTVNASATLSLSVNRLSGGLPGVVMNLNSVDILNGNLFECTPLSKPHNDPDSNEYVCGSSNLDNSMITWISFATAFVLVFSLVNLRFSSWLSTGLIEFLGFGNFAGDKVWVAVPIAVRSFLDVLWLFHISIGFIALVCCVGLVLYPLMKSTSISSLYSTHEEQYAWVTSVAYTHDIFPVALVMIFLCVSVAAIRVIFTGRMRDSRANNSESSETLTASGESSVLIDDWTLKSELVRRSVILGTELIQMVVTLAVNFAYITAVFEGLSPVQLILVQTGLSLYKTIASSVFLPRMTNSLPFRSTAERTRSLTFLSIFSTAAAPTLATFFSDASCFRYVFTGQPSISTTFDEPDFICQTRCLPNELCVTHCAFSRDYFVTTSTVTPPWLYSYQCSSALLSAYAPVLILYFLMSGIVQPVVQSCAIFFAGRYQNSNSNSLVRAFVNAVRGTILADIEGENNDDDRSNISNNEKPNLIDHKLFDGGGVLSRRFVALAILLTYGLSVPLVAVAIVFDSAVTVCWWRKLIRRYLDSAATKDNDSNFKSTGATKTYIAKAHSRLKQATSLAATSSLGTNIALVWGFASLFWCLYIFDAIGDVYGAKVAGCVLLIPTVGLLLFIHLVRSVVESPYLASVLHSTNSLRSLINRIGSSGGVETQTSVSGPPVMNPTLSDTFTEDDMFNL